MKQNIRVAEGRVLLAHEGFIDSKYESWLDNGNVRIIEIRTLSDIPVIHTIRHTQVRTSNP